MNVVQPDEGRRIEVVRHTMDAGHQERVRRGESIHLGVESRNRAGIRGKTLPGEKAGKRHPGEPHPHPADGQGGETSALRGIRWWHRSSDVRLSRHDAGSKHAAGDTHEGWPGPPTPMCLHAASTASSGLSVTRVSSGLAYGLRGPVSSGFIHPPSQATRAICETTRRIVKS